MTLVQFRLWLLGLGALVTAVFGIFLAVAVSSPPDSWFKWSLCFFAASVWVAALSYLGWAWRDVR